MQTSTSSIEAEDVKARVTAPMSAIVESSTKSATSGQDLYLLVPTSVTYVLSRLWVSAFLAQQEEGFTWDEYAPSVLRLPPDRIGEWPRILKEIYDRLEQLDLTSILTSSRQRWTSEFWKTTTDVLGQDPAKIDLEDDFDRAEQKSTEDFDMIVEDDDELELADEELETEQGKCPLNTLTNSSIAEPTPSTKGKKRILYPVVQIFVEDMVFGLGLRRSEVEKRYVTPEITHGISLDQKLKLIKNKIAHKMTTYRGYIRAGNLFLVSFCFFS